MKLAIPPKTDPITASIKKIAALSPCVAGPSDFPKHTAQAKTEFGKKEKIQITATKIFDKIRIIITCTPHPLVFVKTKHRKRKAQSLPQKKRCQSLDEIFQVVPLPK
jgi:hypothetical protein